MTNKFEDASGLSEAVMRRTDNTMINRKWTKCQTMIYKILHRNLKIAQGKSIPTPYIVLLLLQT